MTSITFRFGVALDFAAAHHQLVTTEVLRAAGLDPEQITALVTDGILERVVRGLYRTRGSRSPVQDAAAAAMRHGGSIVSHTTGLFLHDLDVAPPARPLLTLPPGSTSRSTLADLHRSPIERVDRTHRQRIPVTTVARSIVDAAEQLSEPALAAVVNEALSRQMVTVTRIDAALRRVEAEPGRIGSGRVRSVLGNWTDEIVPGSPAEAAAIRRILGFGLPCPVTQHVIVDDGGEFVARVDLAWPDHKVVREYDSDRYHGPDRTEADELRRQRIEALGWDVDALHRRHLLPSSNGWLHELARALAPVHTRA